MMLYWNCEMFSRVSTSCHFCRPFFLEHHTPNIYDKMITVNKLIPGSNNQERRLGPVETVLRLESEAIDATTHLGRDFLAVKSIGRERVRSCIIQFFNYFPTKLSRLFCIMCFASKRNNKILTKTMEIV